MGRFRDWLIRRLGGDGTDPLDPEAYVDVGYVDLAVSDVARFRLEEAGIPALCLEERVPMVLTWRARVMCPARHRDAAARIIDDVVAG